MVALAPAVALALLGAGPAERWVELLPGLERRSALGDGFALEAVRVDLHRYELKVVLARDLGKEQVTARELAAATGALVAVNGGFFDPRLRPVGLRVSGGRVLSGTPSEALAALVVTPGGARIVPGAELRRLRGMSEAVQCTPRLVIDGEPNQLKPQVSRRTAAGIDAGGRVVLVVTREGAIEAGALARLLAGDVAEGGFALRDALNLDGGGSTQLYLRAGGAELDVAGESVADGLTVSVRP
jgi:exopolysaccharide biosynthesis protein